MPYEHDPLIRPPLRRKPKETPGETEQRLSAELAYLMRDPHYRDGDPDYRAYIQRQFRRVYDDPTGKPQPLRIGRLKTFADALEPFDPAREQRLRLGRKAEPREDGQAGASGIAGRTRASSLGEANRRGGQTAARAVRRVSSPDGASKDDVSKDIPPSPAGAHRQSNESGMLRAVEQRGSGEDVADFPDDPELRASLKGTLGKAETLVEIGRDEGYLLAAEYLERYLAKEGGVIQTPWSELLEFSYFRDGQATVKQHYTDWFLDKEKDKAIGQPFLYLRDGDSLTLGTAGTKSNVRWDAVWEPGPVAFGAKEFLPPDEAIYEQDRMAAFGKAAINEYGNLAFSRRGNVIYVAGRVDMRFDERFDFVDKFGLTGWLTLLSFRAPNVSASELHELEVHGLAEPFRTQSSKLWFVSGQIVLVGGDPDPSKSRFYWQELDSDTGQIDPGEGEGHPVFD